MNIDTGKIYPTREAAIADGTPVASLIQGHISALKRVSALVRARQLQRAGQKRKKKSRVRNKMAKASRGVNR